MKIAFASSTLFCIFCLFVTPLVAFDVFYGGYLDDEYPTTMRERMCIAFSPDTDSMLYAAGCVLREVSFSMISWFNRPTGSCNIQYRGSVKEYTDNIPSIAQVSRIVFSPRGNHAYALSKSTQTLTWFARDPTDGTLRYKGSFSAGATDAIGFTNLTDMAISPDGALLVVGATDTLSWYHIDEQSEKLTYGGCISQGAGSNEILATIGSSPHMVFTRSGTYMYAVSPDAKSIMQFTRRENSLYYSGSVMDTLWNNSVYNDAYALGICLSPDDKFLYVGVNAQHTRVTWYSIEFQTGILNRCGYKSSETEQWLGGLSSIATNPQLPMIFVGLDACGALGCAMIDSASGAPMRGATVLGDVTAGGRVTSIAFSANTTCIYAAAPFRIYWFHVDTAVSVREPPAPSLESLRTKSRLKQMPLTDIRGRNVLASTLPQGVYLSGARHGRLILRKAFVR